jgi:hypothetical protein
MRSEAEFRQAKNLMRRGLSDYRIARQIGIPRSTIQNWRKRSIPPRGSRYADQSNWRPPHSPSFSYLLGIYLGDGCLSVVRASGAIRSAFVQIVLDEQYPLVIASCIAALRRTFPEARVGHYDYKRGRAITLQVSGERVMAAFLPLHGAGLKHSRTIQLANWQREIADAHPHEFLRGLLHSDGSRCLNRFTIELAHGLREYCYVRYFFTNYSADIRALFCEYCDLLGIRWTQSNSRNISVSHRDAVAILDSFVGPKR